MSFTRAAALAATLFLLLQLAAGQQPALSTIEQGLQTPGGAAAAPGYLGAELDDAGEGNRGVRVKAVRPNTPAEASGLKANDLIVSIDGKKVANLDDYDGVAQRPAGARMVFTVERGGKQQPLAVTLGTRSATTTIGDAPPAEPPSTAPSLSPPSSTSPGAAAPSLSPPSSPPSSLPAPGSSAPALQPPSTLPAPSTFDPAPRSGGITAQPFEPRSGLDSSPLVAPGASAPPSSSAFPPSGPSTSGGGNASLGVRVISSDQAPGVARTHRGAYVERVNPGSPAAVAGLPSGAVIVQFDGRPINSDDDLIASIRAARPGQEVELSYYDNTDRFAKKSIRLGEAGAPAASTAPGAGGIGGIGGGFGGTLPGATAPPTDSSPRPGLGGGTRPLLNRVERMAENLGRGTGLVAPMGPTGPTTVYDPLAMAALQKTVAELTAAVNSLDARLKALEGHGGATGGAGGASSPSSPPASFGTGSQTPGFSAPSTPITPGFGAPATAPPGPNP